MDLIEQEFNKQKDPATWAEGGSDMHAHMDTLRDLAAECNHVTEFGVRYVVSTWAFLHGCKGTVVSYDVSYLPEVRAAERLCAMAGRQWGFVQADIDSVSIAATDLLFIDTNHTYERLAKELSYHGYASDKYIALHDTCKFGAVGQDGKSPGLWEAIEEFVFRGNWKLKVHYHYCNGLTVLERVNED